MIFCPRYPVMVALCILAYLLSSHITAAHKGDSETVQDVFKEILENIDKYKLAVISMPETYIGDGEQSHQAHSLKPHVFLVKKISSLSEVQERTKMMMTHHLI